MTTHTPSSWRVVFSAVLSLSVVLTGCASKNEQASYDPNKTYTLTVLHTNDHHGRFWQNEDGEWGMATPS